MQQNKITQKALDLCKRMFKEYTGQSLEFAKELLELESIHYAQQSDIPKSEDEVIPVTPQERHNIEQPVINTVRPTQALPLTDDDEDMLPF